jgi:RNA polymerase sigma-70 factor (ECF subfamily)
MAEANDCRRLSDISTVWPVFRLAHSRQRGAKPAQMRLWLRYSTAVHRYLLGALRDADAADELGQEFAFRFFRGDFQGADPERGRFRDYLKTVLSRMVAHYHKQRCARPRSLPAHLTGPVVVTPAPADIHTQFLKIWRRMLLDRAWEALAKVQKENGQPLHAVLRMRVDHPDGECSSAQMAERLAAQFRRKFTAAGVRKLLQRARQRFADFLLDEVEYSLEAPSPEQQEQELRDLGLLGYCRLALQRRG